MKIRVWLSIGAVLWLNSLLLSMERDKDKVNLAAQGHMNTSDILQAIKNGDKELVDKALAAGVSVNMQDSSNCTLLMRACLCQKVEIIELLLNKGADINKTLKDGRTALHIAASQGYTEIVQLLLNRNADLNLTFKRLAGREITREITGITVLMLAVLIGKKELVEMLITAGADVNAHTSNGDTALLEAAYSGDLDIVELLLKNGAHSNARGDKGYTALACAVEQGHKEVVLLLLSKGADSTFTYEYTEGAQGTLLILATHKGQKEIIDILLATGVDINQHNSKGDTPLSIAAKVFFYWNPKDNLRFNREKIKDIVKHLLDKGADPACHKEVAVFTPLMIAVASGQKTYVESFLARDANIDAQYHNYNTGHTVLILAIQRGLSEIALLLLRKGANPNVASKEKYTALMSASSNNDKEVVASLLGLGTCIDFQDYTGNTALIYAINAGHKDMVKLLLDAGASLHITFTRTNERVLTNFTALMNAASHGLKEIVEMLIVAGADINARCSDGSTALHMAAYNGHKEIIKFLLSLDADPNIFNTAGRTAVMVTKDPQIAVLFLKNPVTMVPDVKAAHPSDSDAMKNIKLLVTVCRLPDSGVLRSTPFEYAQMVVDKCLASKWKIRECKKRPYDIHIGINLQRISLNESANLVTTHESCLHQTPLMWMAMFGYMDAIKVLLRKMPWWYLNAQDMYGRTALMYATIYGHDDTVKVLVSAYETLLEEFKQRIPLISDSDLREAYEKHAEKIKRALQVTDNEHKTALAYAVKNKKFYITSRLVSAGARPSIQLIKHLAEQGGHELATRLLVSFAYDSNNRPYGNIIK